MRRDGGGGGVMWNLAAEAWLVNESGVGRYRFGLGAASGVNRERGGTEQMATL